MSTAQSWEHMIKLARAFVDEFGAGVDVEYSEDHKGTDCLLVCVDDDLERSCDHVRALRLLAYLADEIERGGAYWFPLVDFNNEGCAGRDGGRGEA